MKKTTAGTLFIVSAPSGAGKTSLLRALLEQSENIFLSVSHTTRKPRPGEVNGKDYHFVSIAEFEQMVDENAFIEHARVFGNYYGTSRAHIEEDIAAGKNIILEIDWQGAKQVKQHFKDAVSIFILPPSRETLRSRLNSRGQDSEAVIENRMQQAVNEMQHYHLSDFIIVNDDFQRALEQLRCVFQAMMLTTEKQQIKLQKLIYKLLE